MFELQRQRRIARLEVLAAAIITITMAIWATLPLLQPGSPDSTVPLVANQITQIAQQPGRSLPIEAFDTSLIHLPPKPIAKLESPPPPPPPPRLVLLAIAERAGQPNVASIYDPDIDTVVLLSPGQSHAGFTVTSIADHAVVLKSGRRTVSLFLDPGRSPKRSDR